MQGIAYLSSRPRRKRLVTLSSFRGKLVLEWVFLLSQHRIFLKGIIPLQTLNSYHIICFQYSPHKISFPVYTRHSLFRMGEDFPRMGCNSHQRPRPRFPDNAPMLSSFFRLGDVVDKREAVILDGESLDINSVVAVSR